MRTPSALSPTRGVQKGLELKLEPDKFAAWAEDTLVLWRSSRTETAMQMPSPERSKITYSHESNLGEPRRNNRQNREGGEVKWEDHLIVNPDFFVNATNKLGNT